MKPYDPKVVEPKWQKIWEETKLYRSDEKSKQPKQYILDFFPYPSGAGLSVGHVRNYTISDAYPRFKRMQGYNVLHPMGWDAFGLPAENYAIKNKLSPRQATDDNKANYKRQMQMVGLSYDWSREIDSSEPEYYKWTQWFFLLLYKRGLAYQAQSEQWWCETDKTVLANEQVENGKCWRCGNPVTKKSLKQWFFKITEYADRLLEDLDDIDWPEGIKQQQRNWIGRSQGAVVEFEVNDSKDKIDVFTTRPDTLYGATYMVLAPEHELIDQLTTAKQQSAVKQYVQAAIRKGEVERQEDTKEKTGVFTGSYAINPVNGEKIPIWIADYVLLGYGTGAIMAVPAHDQRDYEFATKYDLPIKFVVEPTFGEPQGDDVQSEKIFVVLRNPKKKTALVLNWGPRQKNFGGNMLIGGSVEGGESYQDAAKREIIEETGYTNFKLVKETEFKGHGYFHSNVKKINVRASGVGLLYDLVSDKQKDTKLDEGEKNKFTISWQPIESVGALLDDGIHEAMFRYLALGQVYSGEGLMINSEKYNGSESAVVREQIVKDLNKKNVAQETVNYKMRDWLISRQRYWGAPIPIIHCSKDGAVPVPESDLPVRLPGVKSYQPSGDGKSPLAKIREFVKVRCPKCGGEAERETDTMDGFACSSWYFLRFADPHNHRAAFAKDKAKYWLPVDMYIGGAEHAVMHLLYARFWTKVMYDAKLISFKEPFMSLRNQGLILAADGRKMSKSLGNVIPPEEVIESGYGADALRVFELFVAPYDQDVPWDPQGIVGTRRFLDRLWNLVREYQREAGRKAPAVSNQAVLETQLAATVQRAVKRVTRDIEAFAFNTAVSTLMELSNELYKLKVQLSFASSPQAWKDNLETFVKLLAPIAPHITEELWQQLGHKQSVHTQDWPTWDEQLVKEEMANVVVQVNGKVRANVSLPTDVSEKQMIEAAKAVPQVAKYLKTQKIYKTFTVPSKLVNFVLK